jgi:hypothetical protein
MRASGALLLALLAATARADDSAPSGDSIATAKKDIAAIKSPLSQPDSAGALPTMDMKDFGPTPGAPRPEMSPLLNPEKDPSLDPSKKKTGTGNWLVDAMDKNTSTQASRSKEKDDVLKGDPDLIRADEKGVRLEKDPLSLDDTRERERPKEAEAVYNPLDSFMSGWISTRDHDLLLPSSKGEGIAGADSGKGRADLLPGLEVGPQPAADFTLPQPESPAFGDSRVAANPYIAVMDILPAPLKSFSVPDTVGFAPVDLQDMPRGMSTSGVDPRPIDTSRSFIPDFAQPDDDDKYFKQLKKF